ncbi:MAG: class I SAM-dependent methyltransferase [Thermoanaerobaculia bacterium]
MTIDLSGIPALLNYDAAVDWSERLEREGPFLLRALAGAPSRRVLDLGSATGEHARWLAADGFSVVGIEGVRERWEVAKRLAPPGVEHLAGDLGAVEAMVRGQFGAAICLGSTLPCLIGAEAISRMLIGLRRRFLDGGVFVAQLVNFAGLETRRVTELPVHRVQRAEDELLFRSELGYDTDGVVTVAESLTRRTRDGKEESVHLRHRYLQGWRPDELRTLLDLARFRSVEISGGFAGEPFDAELSDEMVIVAS